VNAPACQRWNGGRASYRPAGEPIDVSKYGVELLDETEAKGFVLGHHYSGSYPSAVCRVGLYRAGDGLVGVAVFSVPAGPKVLDRWVPQVGSAGGVELGRMVLLDDVPANGETWFLARAFKLLRMNRPQTRAVLSFSDPVQRVSTTGEVVMPGHLGTIYQAHNGIYLGRATPRTLHLDQRGLVISERVKCKIRREQQGSEYAHRALVEAGAPAREDGEDGPAYLRRALLAGGFRRFRHPGNHAYGWSLDRRVKLARPGLAYPKTLELAA